MSPEARTLAPHYFEPLVGAGGPDLVTAFQAIVTWGTSTAFRESVMEESGFPLAGDLSAFLLVNQLIYRGAARPTDLADAIQTGRSNVSKIVARLEQAGLVMRGRDPRDDRGVVVVLTGEGRKVGERIVELGLADPRRAVAQWSAEDLATLEGLLVRLATEIDALPGHPLRAVSGVDFLR